MLMRKETHMIVASAIGFILADLLNMQVNTATRVFSSVLSMIGATLPDVFEIAKNYNHRKLFHSKTMLLLSVFAAYSFANNLFVFSFLAGYISHLSLDYFTKKGLPSF